MSRKVSAQELDLIEQVVSEYPEGIGISALEKVLSPQLPNINRRTLQRRLKHLQKNNRITTEGKSIALVYRSARSVDIIAETLISESLLKGKVEIYVPLSQEGRLIRDLVRRPLMRRKPIGYHVHF